MLTFSKLNQVGVRDILRVLQCLSWTEISLGQRECCFLDRGNGVIGPWPCVTLSHYCQVFSTCPCPPPQHTIAAPLLCHTTACTSPKLSWKMDREGLAGLKTALNSRNFHKSAGSRVHKLLDMNPCSFFVKQTSQSVVLCPSWSSAVCHCREQSSVLWAACLAVLATAVL